MKNNNKSQPEYPVMFFDSPDFILEEPKLSPEYVEAYLKPEKQPVSEYCENTTAYD